MKTFTDAIQEIAERYAYNCQSKGEQLDVTYNKITRDEEAELLKLAISDDEIHTLIISEIKDRLSDKIDKLKWEGFFSEDYEEDDEGIYNPAILNNRAA